MANPSLESFGASINAWSSVVIPAVGTVRIDLAGTTAPDVAAGDLTRNLGAGQTEQFYAQVIRYCRLTETDAIKYGRSVKTEVHLGFGIDIDDAEAIEFCQENDNKANFLDAGKTFAQVTLAQQQEIVDKTFGVAITGTTISWPAGNAATGTVTITSADGNLLAEVVPGQDAVVKDSDGRSWNVVAVADDNNMTIANPDPGITNFPGGTGSGTTFFQSQTAGLDVDEVYAIAVEFLTCVKASYWLNYPECYVRNMDMGLGNGDPVFSGTDQQTNPNDPTTVSAFNFRSWPYPVRTVLVAGSDQTDPMETRLRKALLSANGDSAVSAAASDTIFNDLLTDWTARNLLWQ